jgi:hypothetical protein
MTHEPDPASGPPTDYPSDVSLAEVLADFERAGFDGHFDIDEDSGTCLCTACGHAAAAEEVEVADARRLEGASDPAEMASVIGVRCPTCGRQGTVVCRYGPEASAGEAALLRASRGATGR